VSCCREKLVVEALDRSGMSAIGSRYRATASEDATVDTSVCVIVKCKM
jgi:hypothetical protein